MIIQYATRRMFNCVTTSNVHHGYVTIAQPGTTLATTNAQQINKRAVSAAVHLSLSFSFATRASSF